MLGVAEDNLPETPTLHLNIYIYIPWNISRYILEILSKGLRDNTNIYTYISF